MKEPNNESQFDRWIAEAAKKVNGKCTKMHGHSMQRSGISDLWFSIPNFRLEKEFVDFHGWIETKIGKNRCKPIQQIFLEEVRRGGCIGLEVIYRQERVEFWHDTETQLGYLHREDVDAKVFWRQVHFFGNESLQLSNSGF